MMSEGDPPAKRMRLGGDGLMDLSKEELISEIKKQESHIATLLNKIERNCPNDNQSELEERLKQQQVETNRKEKVLLMQLTRKEQELQELATQLGELTKGNSPGASQLRSALLDPALNVLFQRMRNQLDEKSKRLQQATDDMAAWKFTPDSLTGKRLMSKCRTLIQENQELGKQVSTGRTAQLEAELALQKKYSEELKASQDELNEFVIQLDEEVEGMQSTICALQQQLRDGKEDLATLKAQQVMEPVVDGEESQAPLGQPAVEQPPPPPREERTSPVAAVSPAPFRQDTEPPGSPESDSGTIPVVGSPAALDSPIESDSGIRDSRGGDNRTGGFLFDVEEQGRTTAGEMENPERSTDEMAGPERTTARMADPERTTDEMADPEKTTAEIEDLGRTTAEMEDPERTTKLGSIGDEDRTFYNEEKVQLEEEEEAERLVHQDTAWVQRDTSSRKSQNRHDDWFQPWTSKEQERTQQLIPVVRKQQGQEEQEVPRQQEQQQQQQQDVDSAGEDMETGSPYLPNDAQARVDIDRLQVQKSNLGELTSPVAPFGAPNTVEQIHDDDDSNGGFNVLSLNQDISEPTAPSTQATKSGGRSAEPDLVEDPEPTGDLVVGDSPSGSRGFARGENVLCRQEGIGVLADIHDDTSSRSHSDVKVNAKKLAPNCSLSVVDYDTGSSDDYEYENDAQEEEEEDGGCERESSRSGLHVPNLTSPVKRSPSSPVKLSPSSPVKFSPSSPVKLSPSSPVKLSPSSPVKLSPSSPVKLSPSSPVKLSPGSPVKLSPGCPSPPSPNHRSLDDGQSAGGNPGHGVMNSGRPSPRNEFPDVRSDNGDGGHLEPMSKTYEVRDSGFIEENGTNSLHNNDAVGLVLSD